ncbi:acid protease [Desarmillaria tabescens]|uniref:Acid protease n=1 Tax=Armillaria tabescens TaxID=1929756 RepID=A0AA39JX27_ARMTA|nr:acid protease [Desarmillaria tabescens]KAK0450505.1 acid protease [Desarmillaria tabescens]
MLSAFFMLSSLIVSGISGAIDIPRRPVSLPIARKFNFNGTSSIVERDRARAATLRSRANGVSRDLAGRAIINEDVDNAAVIYTASIGVGSPPTFYNLIVDTGSSNTWVGADKMYVRTRTSKDTFDVVSVSYGSGSFIGWECIDQVTITPNLTIKSQSIGAAFLSSGFNGTDGILGIGPIDLTLGTLYFDNDALIPTVTDNLYNQRLIMDNAIGVYFAPTTDDEVTNGELSWGGPDNSKIRGEISYAPLTNTSPASKYWGIDESITYGAEVPILSSTAGVVDTGTTFIYIASDAFKRYQSATGATVDNTTGLLCITSSQYSNLSSLYFNINGKSYELTPNAQIWPRSLNTAIGGSPNDTYLIVNDIGHNSGQGLDFINGYTFLERYYTIYDTANSRIGFAATSTTNATTN